MKSSDLAALGALGLAGYAAYNKFGNNAAPASGVRPGATLGNSGSANDYSAGEDEARDTFRSDAGMRPDAEMSDTFRSDRGMRPDAEMQDTFRAEGMRPDAAMPVSNGIGAKGQEVLGRELRQPGQNWGGEGRARTRTVAPAAEVSRTPVQDNRFVSNEQGATANVPRRPGQAPRATASSSEEGMKAYVPRRSGQVAGPIQAGARPAVQLPTRPGQAAPVTYTRDKYGNIVDSNGKVSRTIFSAGQEGNAARNGMKRGGAVKKMASGGLATSKMSSKPKQSTASSRGDGIAQRGKTRGQLR